MHLTLSGGPSYSTIGNTLATGTIYDDDTPYDPSNDPYAWYGYDWYVYTGYYEYGPGY
jgi:hypothetical protein